MRSRVPRARHSTRLAPLERLEVRRLPATFTVINTDDGGAGSFRQAIVDANAAANPSDDVDHIEFNIPGTGVHTLQPTTPLPDITDPILIDGYTQPGASANTNPINQGSNAAIRIVLDGSAVPGFFFSPGLKITAGQSTVRGLAVGNWAGAGIVLDRNGANHVSGDSVGTAADGMTAAGNLYGLLVECPDNTIGGTTPADRNIISGNNTSGRAAISLTQSQSGGNSDASRTVIQGNFIGTDASGTAVLPNNLGISGLAGSNSTIGGTAAGAGNIIAGNSSGGINLSAISTTGNLIQGNFIGTDPAGTIDLGNTFLGIGVGGSNNTIGGTAAGAGNIIAFTKNAGGGADGVTFPGGTTGDSLLHNSIFGNQGPGFVSGPGTAPQLISATPTTITGTLTGGAANASYHLEFFATPDTGHGFEDEQGKTFLGEEDVTTDGSGNVDFSISPDGGVPAGQFLTATATDPADRTAGFSAAIKVAVVASADLGVTIAATPEPVAPGGLITYTFTVTNSGPDAAQVVTLTAPVPTGTTYVSMSSVPGWTVTAPQSGTAGGTITATTAELAAGASPVTFMLVVAVDGGAADGSTISETASVAGSVATDPNAANNTGEMTTTVQAPLPAKADLGVTVAAAPDPIASGELLTYTITVTNAGPDAASGVGLSDVLPVGTTFVSLTAPTGWTASTPAVRDKGTVSATASAVVLDGYNGVFVLVVRVDPGATSGSTIADTASVSGTTADPKPDNNSDIATVTVQTLPPTATADLVVTQTAAPGTAIVGQDDVTFTITVTNRGPDTASDTVLTEALPAGAVFVSATGGAPSEGRLHLALGDLVDGSSRTFIIVVRPQSAGTLTATATVSSAVADPSAADNTAVASSGAVVPTPTPTSTSSPTPTPATSPTVLSVHRFGIHMMPTRLIVTFNEPLDPATAQAVSDYQIVGPSGRRIAIDSAVYDAINQTVTLHPRNRISIHRPYRFTVSGVRGGAVADPLGDLPGGASSVQPATDYATTLTWRTLVLPAWYVRTHFRPDHRATQPKSTIEGPNRGAATAHAMTALTAREGFSSDATTNH